MIITKTKPFSQEEIARLKEHFDAYVKTVIDVKKKVCSAGMDRHFEGEEILLNQGSKQSDLWGGGIDLETLTVDCNSFINIRPNDQNLSNEIQDPKKRMIFEKLTKYFFKQIYER